MPDEISLRIDGREIKNFTGYAIGGDLFNAADTWTLILANPGFRVRSGVPAQLYVNRELEMTGLIDTPIHGYNKREGNTIRLQGRDLMGLVVDTYCEEFRSIQGVTIKALAEYLLYGKRIFKNSKWQGVDILDRKKIVVPEKVTGGLARQKKTKTDPVAAIMGGSTPHAHSQIEPGMTVHQVLSQYAAARGLLFWSAPDGTMTFGVPKARGEGEPLYTFTNRKDGRGNNIENASLYDDTGRRWSRITVVGQAQASAGDGTDTSKVNAPPGIATDAGFPFRKPYVTRSNNDAQTPAMQARAIRDKMRRDGWRLDITVAGHSQGGHNYRYNELCRVCDEDLDLNGVYLVYGRTFELDKKEGRRTHLQIGLPREAA